MSEVTMKPIELESDPEMFDENEIIGAIVEMNTTPPLNKHKKVQFRFRPSDDVELLKEIELVLPFAAEHGQVKARWETVAANCGKKFDHQRASKRFGTLISDFKKKTTKSLKSSGTSEQYTELDQLLQDLSDRIEDCTSAKQMKKEVKTTKKIAEVEAAEFVRDAALKGMTPLPKSPTSDGDSPGPSKVKPRKSLSPAIASVKSRDDRLIEILLDNNNLKKRKLDMEERRLELEEKKFNREEGKTD